MHADRRLVVGSWRGTGLAPVCSVKRVVSLQRKKKMEKTCQKPGERREGITFTVMNENMSLLEQWSPTFVAPGTGAPVRSWRLRI